MLAPKRMDALWEDLLVELDKTIYVYRLTAEEADAVIELYKAAQLALEALNGAEWQEWDFGNCPWCDNPHYNNNTGEEIGHEPDCKRKIAISALKLVFGVQE